MNDDRMSLVEKELNELRRRARELRYACLAIFVSSFLLAGAALWTSIVYADRQEKKLCEVVVLSDDAYHQPRPAGAPPITPTGRKIADGMHRLRSEIGCKPSTKEDR
jgi:hypothetical protein